MTDFTEAALFKMLQSRLTVEGNGGSGRHAVLAQVRDFGGFRAGRTFDALSVDLWDSGLQDITIYEIKSARSDWKRELVPNLDKSLSARNVADYFTIIAAPNVVKIEELPKGWGLLVAGNTGKLRQVVKPTRLTEKPKNLRARTISRDLMCGMLRASPDVIPGNRRRVGDEAALRLEISDLGEEVTRLQRVARRHVEEMQMARQVIEQESPDGYRGAFRRFMDSDQLPLNTQPTKDTP